MNSDLPAGDRPKKELPCPGCGDLLFELYTDDAMPVESARLRSDEHGKYVVCLNSDCRREVRLVQPSPGVWLPTRK